MDTPIITRKKRMIRTVLRQWLDNKYVAQCLEMAHVRQLVAIKMASVFQQRRKELAGNEGCFAHDIGSECECEYCLENPDCDPNNKGKTCRDNYQHSEMCAECILLSEKPRYSPCEFSQE